MAKTGRRRFACTDLDTGGIKSSTPHFTFEKLLVGRTVAVVPYIVNGRICLPIFGVLNGELGAME